MNKNYCKLILIIVLIFNIFPLLNAKSSDYKKLALVAILSHQEPEEECIELNNTIDSAEIKILNLGKEAIPYLIDLIDIPIYGYHGTLDPRSSLIKIADVSIQPQGMKAIYIIKLILTQQKNTQSLIYESITYKYIDGKIQIHEPLTVVDMQEIKKIFQKWWQKNKNKTAKELKHDFEKGRGPLYNSPYF